MKMYSFARWPVSIQWLVHFYALTLFLFMGSLTSFAEDEEQALIVPVEAGVRIIRAETWDAQKQTWKAVGQAYLKGDEGTVKMRIPQGLTVEDLRLMTSRDPLMPEGFIESAKTVTWDGDKYNVPTRQGTMVIPPSAPSGITTVTRSLTEERNLWEVDGDVAYFYNRHRGLKLFDLKDATNPIKLGSMSLFGKGEQMYLHEGTHLVLLTSTESLSVGIVSVENSSAPEIVASIEGLPGAYLESYKREDRLWVLTHEYDQRAGEDRATLTTIDLSDINNPVVIDTFEFLISELLYYSREVGYEVFVRVTSDVFIISNTVNRAFSEVILVDFSGAQEPSLIGRVYTARIRDKFNMRYAEGILTTIGDHYNTYREQTYENTILETFGLKNNELTALGSLELVKNKNFQASCFYGDQAYVMVLDQVDTLLAVDLSDPNSPTIRDRLDVLGSSAYLERLDSGQVLSVGLQDRRVVVSLFDLEGSEGITLADQVFIGEEGTYSWSEESYRDKGISLFNSEGLILLPFYRYDSSGDLEVPSAGIQLVRFSDEGLDLGGSLSHRSIINRMVSLGNETFLTLSKTQMVTCDLSDLERPEISSALTIFWGVDSVFKLNDHFVQLDKILNDPDFSILPADKNHVEVNIPALLVTSVDDTESVVAELDLPEGFVWGESMKDDILYLLYKEQPYDEELDEYGSLVFKLVLVDLSNPEKPELRGSVEVEAGIDTYFNARMEPRWINADTLIWTSKSDNYESISRKIRIPDSDEYFYTLGIARSPEMVILSMDVSDLSAPHLLDFGRYEAAGGVGDTGVHFAGNKGYFTWDYLELLEPSSLGRNEDEAYTFPPSPLYRVEYKHEVVCIDLSDPADLSFGPSLEINGKLIGVEEHELGALLFTSEDINQGVNPLAGGFVVHSRMHAYLHDGVQLLSVDTFDWTFEEGTAPSTYWLRFSEGKVFRPLTTFGDPYSQVIERLDFNPKGWFERGEDLEIGGSWIETLYVDSYLLTVSNEEVTYWGDLDDVQSSKWIWPTKAVSDGWWNISMPIVIPSEGIWKASGSYGVSSWSLSASVGVWSNLNFQEYKSNYWAERVPLMYIPVETVSNWEEMEQDGLKLSGIDLSDEVGRLDGLQWRFRSRRFKNPDEAAMDAGDGWFQSSWFGWYHGGEQGSWIWHLDHGWNYAQGTGNASYQYDKELGWYYAGASLYPYIYTYNPAGWLYYLKETGPTGIRWFYDYRGGKNDWISMPRSEL